MKLLNNKLLLTKIVIGNRWGYEDKDEVKCGKLAFDFTGKDDGEVVTLKKGTEVYYQYGSDIKLEGEEYVLVNLSNVVCLK